MEADRPLEINKEHDGQPIQWRIIEVDTGTDKRTQIQIRAYSNGNAWWLSGEFWAVRPEGRRFESHSSRHVGTLGKSFTLSCLQ